MSRFSKQLCKQLVTLARQGRGSYKTVADRSRIAERFSERLSELNIQIRDVKHIKTSHIEKYIESRKADNLSLRTLQNEMSAIRSVLLSAGRNKLADPSHINLSNQALGILVLTGMELNFLLQTKNLMLWSVLLKEKMKALLLLCNFPDISD